MNLTTTDEELIEARIPGLIARLRTFPVLVLIGRSGSGKTTLLEQARLRYPRVVIITGPCDVGLSRQIDAIQWDAVDTVAVDEFMVFDQPDAGQRVNALVAQALDLKKGVVLTMQMHGDLELAGIHLPQPPVIVDIEDLPESIMASRNEKIFMKIRDLSDEEVRMFDRLSDGASSGGAAA